jgi:hypothetical protein
MRKHLTIPMLASLVLLAAGNSLLAQHQNQIAARWPGSATGNATAATEAAIAPVFHHTGVYVKAKVMRSFLMQFKDITDVNWTIVADRYFAFFTMAGKPYRAMFDSNGFLVYTLFTGTEKELPKDIRQLVKSNYVEYTIGTVWEIKKDGQSTWIINLEDPDNLVVVCAADDTLNELHHYKTHF